MEGRPQVLVLADDLSGAADCSVAWSRRGHRAVVALDAAEMGGEAAVLALDMNTRNLPATNARATATNAVEVCGLATHILYQKMDSALRGNWAAELSAIRSAIGRRAGAAPLAIVAPALPSAGRATLGGRGFIYGRRLEESAIWRDGAMAGPADLPGMLAGAGLEARLLPLATVRAGGGTLAASFREFISANVPAVVCDAESDEDLAAIAGGALGVPGCIWVGSAGLMHALVAAMGAPQGSGDQPSITLASSRPILTVVGSASEVSRRQFRVLSQEAPVVPVQISVDDLLSGMAAARVHQTLEDTLDAGIDAAVTVSPGRRTPPADGPLVTAALGAVVAPHLARLGGIVLTGGETARAIFDAGGVRTLELLFEIEPGVPIGRTLGKVQIPAVTKAGSFGDDRTLLRCRNMLRRAIYDEREIGPGRAGGPNA